MSDAFKQRLRRLLPNNAFARSVSVLVGGTAGAQLLTVLVSPVLTRLYSPEDFGLLAVYASLLALTGVISSLRYELAIPLPEDDGEAANVAALSLILVGISTLLTGVWVLLLNQPIAEALGMPQLVGYLWLLPVGVLLGGAYKVFNYWSVRTKHFSTIAGTKLRHALATIVIQLGAFKLGGIALLFGQVAGQSVGTTSLGRPALASAGFRQVSWQGIVTAVGRYRRFPIFSTWAGFANTAGLQLPPLMFAALFGPAMAGLYSLANRILSLPINLIGSTISQVFLSDGAEANRSGQLGRIVRKLHYVLAQIAFPPALILIIIGPDMFGFLFGEKWREAGVIAQWMAPWIYLVFITSPLSSLFVIREKQRQGLVFQISLLLARVAAIVAGYYIGNFFTAIVLFSITSALMRVALLIVLLKDYYSTMAAVFYPTMESAIWSAVLSLPLFWALYIHKLELFGILLATLSVFILVSGRYVYLVRYSKADCMKI